MTKAILTNSAAGTTGAATNQLHDIKPPVFIPSGWGWVWWGLIACAIAAALIWAWKILKEKPAMPGAPPVPPHVLARQRLQAALSLIGQPREFCIAVSDAIRWYLEERFNFRAPERTTEEFLYELQNTDLLTAEQKRSLGEFLQRCDLVKFAKYEPSEPELRDLHGSALRLVEETEPRLQPAPEIPTGQAPVKTEPAAVADETGPGVGVNEPNAVPKEGENKPVPGEIGRV